MVKSSCSGYSEEKASHSSLLSCLFKSPWACLSSHTLVSLPHFLSCTMFDMTAPVTWLQPQSHTYSSVCCVKGLVLTFTAAKHHLLPQILCRDWRDRPHCVCTYQAFYCLSKNKVGDYIIHLSKESCRRCNLKQMGRERSRKMGDVRICMQHTPVQSRHVASYSLQDNYHWKRGIMIVIPLIAFAIQICIFPFGSQSKSEQIQHTCAVKKCATPLLLKKTMRKLS